MATVIRSRRDRYKGIDALIQVLLQQQQGRHARSESALNRQQLEADRALREQTSTRQLDMRNRELTAEIEGIIARTDFTEAQAERFRALSPYTVEGAELGLGKMETDIAESQERTDVSAQQRLFRTQGQSDVVALREEELDLARKENARQAIVNKNLPKNIQAQIELLNAQTDNATAQSRLTQNQANLVADQRDYLSKQMQDKTMDNLAGLAWQNVAFKEYEQLTKAIADLWGKVATEKDSKRRKQLMIAIKGYQERKAEIVQRFDPQAKSPFTGPSAEQIGLTTQFAKSAEEAADLQARKFKGYAEYQRLSKRMQGPLVESERNKIQTELDNLFSPEESMEIQRAYDRFNNRQKGPVRSSYSELNRLQYGGF